MRKDHFCLLREKFFIFFFSNLLLSLTHTHTVVHVEEFQKSFVINDVFIYLLNDVRHKIDASGYERKKSSKR